MKVALVTGGATGIGAATVSALAADNLSVALHYSNSKEAAIKLADQLKSNGAKVEIFHADLTQKGGAEDLVKNVTGELGAIDILINNAGLMSDASITKMSDELWDEAINLNLSVVFKLIRATADHMLLKSGEELLMFLHRWH